MDMLNALWNGVKPWAQRNITFGLVLAIATEAPRWVFAFVGAHEPVWAGIAVAVLMSFAAAQGWDEYWKRRDSLLLSMLVGQVASAMVIITPVIFAMAMSAGHGMQIKDIVAPWYLWVWAGTLVVSTFLPLIVVAYVEVQRHESAKSSVQTDVQPKAKRSTIAQYDSVQPVTPIVQPAIETVQADTEDVQPDPKGLAAQLAAEGLSYAQIAERLSVHRNTVGKWLRAVA